MVCLLMPKKRVRPYTEDEAEQLAISQADDPDELFRLQRKMMSRAFSGRRRPRQPTKEAPGLPAKMNEMAERVAAGEQPTRLGDLSIDQRIVFNPTAHSGIKPKNGVKTSGHFVQAEERRLSEQRIEELEARELAKCWLHYDDVARENVEVMRDRLGLPAIEDLDPIAIAGPKAAQRRRHELATELETEGDQ